MATPLPPSKPKEAPPLEFVRQRYEGECPIDAVKPHPKNANEGDVGTVYQSQSVNGFYGVIYVQESSGFILAGNTRYFSAVYHGAKTIPVIWLDVDDAKALRILTVDNRARDLAKYDENALERLLGEIMEGSGTLDGTGFDDDEYDDLIKQLDSPPGSFGSGQQNNKGPGMADDDPNATETGQDGAAASQGREDAGGEVPKGLKRLGFNLVTESDHETILKAVQAALEGGGVKTANIKKRNKDEHEPYNPMTIGLLAICVSYLEQKGEAVGDDQK